jgi:hypothetical protein
LPYGDFVQIDRRILTKNPQTDFERNLEQELLRVWSKLAQIVNGGLKFSDNFDMVTLSVADSGNADTEFTVAHTLKRVPVGYIVIKINKAAAVYDSGTAWTATDIYLKANAANCALTILVF